MPQEASDAFTSQLHGPRKTDLVRLRPLLEPREPDRRSHAPPDPDGSGPGPPHAGVDLAGERAVAHHGVPVHAEELSGKAGGGEPSLPPGAAASGSPFPKPPGV